jgi:poly-gamma-glutamate capsule biosynthesis protein CapA/YwtB (metallophosphatase superfamily)
MSRCVLAWLFVALLRMPLLAREPAGLTVTAVGDVRITAAQANDHGERLRKIRLRGDLVFANFEGVIGDPVPSDPWKFAVPREAAGILRQMGITAVSLANNHALDLGEDGYRETAAALRGEGFQVAGGDEPGTIAKLKAHRVRLIAFSFCSQRNNVNHPDAVPAFSKAAGEFVIVSAHMGGENHLSNWIFGGMEYFGDEPRGDVVAFSRRSIDAGADLVLGHGPHMPRGLELYKGKLIVYSLGNFAFDYPGAAWHPHAPGYSISIRLDESGNFSTGRIDSYDLRNGVPVPDKSAAAYRAIRDLTWRNLKQTALSFPGNGRVEKSHKE